MFVCTCRAHTVRMMGILILTLTLAMGIAIFADAGMMTAAVPADAVEAISYHKIKTDSDRLQFLASLGWQTTGEVVAEETFTIPDTFDRVMLGYNEIQKNQGLDLSRYRKKKVTRYTYEVTNYEGYEGKVYVNLILYRNKVVAGDVSSADPMGFVRGLEKTEGGT